MSDINWKEESMPANLVQIKNPGKYVKLLDRQEIQAGDLIHIEDDVYAKVSEKTILCKLSCNKYTTILRKSLNKL